MNHGRARQNMKNVLCMLLAVLLASLPLMTGVAEVMIDDDDDYDEPIYIIFEDEDDSEDTEEDETDEVLSSYAGVWQAENATIFIDEEDDGIFSVFIFWNIGDTMTDIWEYTCTLDAETGMLAGEGNKIHEVYDEEGETVSSDEVYTDGSVIFMLEEDALIWLDAKENVAKNLRFERGEDEDIFIEADFSDPDIEEQEEEDDENGSED